MFKRIICSCLLYFLLVLVVLPFYPVKVSADEPLSISGLAVETKSFRPFREKGKFSYFLNRTSQVTAEIQDSDFNLVRTLALMEPGTSGKNTLEWDGKDEDGNFIEGGKYILSMSAMTDDGSSALISKEIEFEFDAPEGTGFKNNIYKIEEREKKQHVHEVPEKMKLYKWGWLCNPISWFFIPFFILDDIFTGIDEGQLISRECKEGPFRSPVICYEKDYEEFVEMNREIDEYNADIDKEIAEKNREIDEFNEKVKDTVTITMELVD